MVVAMTSDDADDFPPHVFDQTDCIKQFINYLVELTENDTRYVTAIAHNFKGYDSYFIVQRLVARHQKFDQTRTGGKLLQLTLWCDYLRFIDSLSFFPMALSECPKTFGLDRNQFQKGYFPHLFNTQANANYEGPMPPKEDYAPESMSAYEKSSFETWYNAQVANNVIFNLR